MKIDDYLKRIRLSDAREVSLSYLEKLQFQHVTGVPFENLDILRGIPLSLHIPEIYEKIVSRRRGGLCYELNGLFNALLEKIGFTTHLVAGTIYRGNKWGAEDTHAAILVQQDGINYLVDVGFGGNSPRKPIPATGEEIRDADGYYRVRSYPQKQDSFVLEKKERDTWVMLYRFDVRRWALADFATVCEQAQYASDSPFNKAYFLMNVTEQGRKTLFDHSLTTVEGLNKTKETIAPDRLDDVVKQFLNTVD